MGERNELHAHAIFGDTNRADGVPDYPDSSEGPVYLEGRLVLSLSFQKGPVDARLATCDDDPIERFELWDDLAETWCHDGLAVLRYEQADVVARSWPSPIVLWEGAVDTSARVIPEPDLDEAGMMANRRCDLRWRRV